MISIRDNRHRIYLFSLTTLQIIFYVSVLLEIPSRHCNNILSQMEVRNYIPSVSSAEEIAPIEVAGHQAGNHSCPTYCPDTFNPVCVQIQPKAFKDYKIKMVNHCHADLFSCATGLSNYYLYLYSN